MNNLKRTLPALLSMLAGRAGINLRIAGDTAYHDKANNLVNIPTGDMNDPRYRVSALGLTVHEGGHARFTDSDDSYKPDAATPPGEAQLRRWVWNALEDIRMEAKVIEDLPGARTYLSETVKIVKEDRGWLREVTPEDGALAALQMYVLCRLRSEVLGQPCMHEAIAAEKALRSFLSDAVFNQITNLMFEVQKTTSTAEVTDLSNRIVDAAKELLEDESKQNAEAPQPDPDSSPDADQDDAQASSGEASDQDEGEGESGAGSSGDDEGDGSDDATANASGGDSDAGDSDSDADGQSAGQDGGDPTAEAGGDTPDASSSDKSAGSGLDPKDVLARLLSGEDTGIDADMGDVLTQVVEDASDDDDYRSMDLDVGESPEIGHGSPAIVPELLRAVGRSSRMLASRLQTALEAQSLPESSFDSFGVDVDVDRVPRLFQGKTDIFVEEEEAVDVNTAVQILVDRSGSMNGPEIETAMEAAAATALAIDRIPDSTVSVAAFPGHQSTLMMQCDFDEPVRPSLARFLPRAGGGTPTAEALYLTGMRMANRHEQRKLIIVITDGQPNAPKDTEHAIKMLRNAGVEVVGVGIGPCGTDAVEDLFTPYGVGIESVNDLPRVLFGILRRSFIRQAA